MLAGVALASIVACSLLLVVMVADRPSILSPTTHSNFFPGWMAGPLGGLWPGLTRNSTTLRYLFTGAIVVMYASYLIALRYGPQLRARWIIAAIGASQASFLLAPPLALTDIFNYVNYARMEVVHHLNPYTTIPILEPHSDPSFALSNWHELLSPYGPLFTLITFVVAPLGVAGAFWAIKCILAAAAVASIALVWRCARMLGRDPVVAIVLVGLNPIVLVWGLGGDHNDFLMMFFILLGFYLLLLGGERERAGMAELGAGAALITAAAIKASAGVLLPVVVVGLLRRPRRLGLCVLGMAGASLILGAASLIAFGLHVPDLSTQSELVTSESVPNLIGLALGSGGENTTLHTLMSAALALALLLCCLQAYARGAGRGSLVAADRLLSACGWASVALLVTLSWVLPWYVLWVLPFAALSSSRRLRGAALLLGAYLIIAWAPASGLLWNAVGFHPEKTSLGRLHQRYVKELLN